jgi:cullin-4
MVKDPSKDQVMVSTLLSFKDELDKTLRDSFDNNPTFANAFKESFETFINSRRNKPAEMLAKYFDTMLRSGAKVVERRKKDHDVTCELITTFCALDSNHLNIGSKVILTKCW